MKRALLISAILFTLGFSGIAQQFDLDTIQFTGNINHRINLVILSDGYQSSELSQFIVDANSFTETFFSNTPYREYQQFFNVFAIKVPSNESGASHPGTATDVTEPEHPIIEVDNYFGSTFDYFNIHRLLVPVKSAAITTVLANNFPSYDQVVVLVNTPYYGGSGGPYATTTRNPASSDVAIHELGHSFAGLKDEYWVGDVYAAEGINMTKETDPTLVRWKNWIDDNGIGIYQHCCGGTSASWHKPHENCKMQVLGMPFCSVCIEGTIEMIHSLTNPLIGYTPSDINVSAQACTLEFEIELVEPVPNTFRKRWMLNDLEIGSNVRTLQIAKQALNPGANELTVIVEDTSELLRIDNHENIHLSTVSWMIMNNAKAMDVVANICRGDSVYLQGAYQTESGIYYDTLVASIGCDSIIATTLNVETIDLSVVLAGESLIASAPGASFQWLRCNDFSPIEGATDPSFTASTNGDYAVEISLNGCKETSGCFTVNTVGFSEESHHPFINISPNPTKGRLILSIGNGSGLSIYSIRVVSSDGRIVFNNHMSAPEMTLEMADFGNDGLYYLQLISPEGSIIDLKKIVMN